MQCKHLFLMTLIVATSMQAEPGNRSLVYARQASAMLGPTLWKRVILVRNSDVRGRYPRTLGAVVFELGDMLWFYASTDGTQSLSTVRGHAERDAHDLGPLLTRIDPGFTHWEYDSAPNGPDKREPVPPNACFIQSIALLRRRVAAGTGPEHARLLSYYVSLPTGVMGHTVLYVKNNEGPAIIDPLSRRSPLRVRTANVGDAKSVASCIRPDISSARWVPMDPQDFAAEKTYSDLFAND
jgi:hypothetical protein